jgi:heat shock protein HtpX
MSLTFDGLIQHNKRVSLLLVGGMVLLTAVIAGAFIVCLTGDSGPQSFGVGAALGAAAAIGGAGFSYFFGGSVITAISGARAIAKADDPELVNVVEEMAIAAGVPVPKIYIIDDLSPNAFASGRDPQHALVAITSGLRSKLTRDELQAVIAHEVAHIKNYDIRLMMLVAVFAGIIVLMADFFMRSLRFRSRPRYSSSSGESKGGGAAVVVFLVIGFILALVAPLLARILQFAVSREREYLADATAVQLARNPLALVSALKKISSDPEELEADNRATEHLYIINPDPNVRLKNPNRDSIFATHPPLIKRINRLLALGGAQR